MAKKKPHDPTMKTKNRNLDRMRHRDRKKPRVSNNPKTNKKNAT